MKTVAPGQGPQKVPGWLLVVSLLGGGLIALVLGLPAEWDLFNYHLYNPHALLHDRLAIDAAPAQIQSFLNPWFYLPHYLLFNYVHPAAMVFVLGVIQGAHWYLLYRILAELTISRPVPRWILLLVSSLGLLGPIFVTEWGGTQGDTILSVLVLTGLLIALQDLRSPEQAHATRFAFLAGILLGLATAFKLVFALYAIALAVAWFVTAGMQKRWMPVFGYGFGVGLGFLLGGMAWFSYLYFEYQNPLFPYLNQLFHSSWVGDNSFRDLRFMPRNTLEWLFYPFIWLMDGTRVWEFPFRDVRVVALLPVVIGLLLFFARSMLRKFPGLLLLSLFLVVSYALWLPLFSIYRYLSVVELLAPVFLFAAAVVLYPRRHLASLVLVGLLLSQLLVDYQRARSIWELNPRQASVLETLEPGSLVLINGYAPVGYTALWLDDRIPMVRTRANFMHELHPPFNRYRNEAERRVSQQKGPVYLLLHPSEQEEVYLASDLARMSLRWGGVSACKAVFQDTVLQSKTELLLCPLEKIAPIPE